jgi:integrase/recombinase XerD
VMTRPNGGEAPDEAELAAWAFLARYKGRTLDAYRHDLRALFQWGGEHDLAVLQATRAQLELYRAATEQRGLAASTIDRRLSTACGFYRSAHIDGPIATNPAHYVRRPRCTQPNGAAWTAANSDGSSSPPSGSTTPTPP